MIKQKFQAQAAVSHKIKTENSCKESGCAESERGCHCTKIVNAEIESVDIPDLAKLIWDEIFMLEDRKSFNRDAIICSIFYGGEEVDLYCINRLLTILKFYKKDIWDINIVDGYYGQIVDSITIKPEPLKELNKHLTRIMNYDTLKEKIEYCLFIEYGRVLAILSDKDYDLFPISYRDIEFSESNTLHVNKISFEDISHYFPEKYSGPRGICKKIGSKYWILDGFHRILAMKDSREKFDVFVVKDRN